VLPSDSERKKDKGRRMIRNQHTTKSLPETNQKLGVINK
jgi:hypothetical protein